VCSSICLVVAAKINPAAVKTLDTNVSVFTIESLFCRHVLPETLVFMLFQIFWRQGGGLKDPAVRIIYI